MDYIKKLVSDFIGESIRTENPAGLCFASSFPLLIYLATKQVSAHLKTGKVPTILADGTPFEVDHFWLQTDKEGTILDTTIRQFNNESEPIYMGKLVDNEVTKTYKLCTEPSYMWFPQVYNCWKAAYVDRTYPIDGDAMKRIINYNLKLAAILNMEMKKVQSRDKIIDYHYGLYFKPIFIFLDRWHTGKIKFEIIKENLPKTFEDLISEALRWADTERKRLNHS